ncbi:hypothetical protein RPO_04625 [Rickettsia rickettsii str. Arizona]|uniref:Uncharacterized protein n=1 Tax=Rickettsia rickettsii (strain Sheila Smith) TaxID=392021 RepID=A0A0H3AXX1_RICRS|nr:hypothetical protein A1G_04650 [Rickettsia rickettsii str. 'Sheila Smith']AFB21997.1 hypothetical protein RPN_02335 [Rickettsia rickettsii str. Brazil]AFB25122.1 hypothetical protein RPO_04625 [Rickettsia rickettsii str. Arizona]AFB27803.1 hypothetical protein RPJ_04580 [Rickettsia rickettsii str. Hino]AFB30462.1 hypothetical protein RPM_04595 [Rickettsia rickettsii str. Hauke]AJG33775.1 hypothetical protein RRR_04360 [Rickettsia rickettsii str. R]AJG35115.1 hypothetical protein RRM_04385 
MDRFPVVIPWLDHGIPKYDKKILVCLTGPSRYRLQGDNGGIDLRRQCPPAAAGIPSVLSYFFGSRGQTTV